MTTTSRRRTHVALLPQPICFCKAKLGCLCCPELASFFYSNAAVPLVRMPEMPQTDCTEILKALADRTRLRIVKALLAEPSGVNDLSAALQISQYNTSKHLRILRLAGVVEVEPAGSRREYSIAAPLRKRLAREGPVLDFGCCSFRFDRLPD
jgi:DNA-binding transcriptional ArsR family regulator